MEREYDKTRFMWASWFVLTALLYWVLRIWYWGSVSEELFSDMADFDRVAHGILNSGSFSFDHFRQSYTTPTLPLFRAAQILLFGESLTAWRWFQGVFCFAGLVWCVREVTLRAQSRLVGLLLFLTVAIAESSIFWSLKFAREGLAEAFLYWTTALVLWTLRVRTLRSFYIAGFISMAGILIRGSSLPLVPLILCYFAAIGWFTERDRAARRVLYKGAALFLLGVMTAWTPWVVRSLVLYGEPVFVSTQGPYAFFWDRGPVEVTLPSGEVMKFRSQSLQRMAYTQYPNDAVAARENNKLVWLWYEQNRELFPQIFWERLRRTVEERDVNLTLVPREQILPAPIGLLLPDKSMAVVFIGTITAIVACLLQPIAFIPLALGVYIPWIFTATIVGLPRMLEPSIPGILFFVALVPYLGWIIRNKLSGRFSQKQCE